VPKVKPRSWIVIVTVFMLVGAALLAGCSGGSTTTTPPAQTTPPAASTTPPSSTESSPTSSTPPSSTSASPTLTGADLGKQIFETGDDNNGKITATGGIKTITVDACKNCHGADAKGLKSTGAPDIRAKTLMPGYTAAKFATAVTTGKDNTGKPLESKMPRFTGATADDTAGLWAYLQTLK
jgi:cytochrome c553